MSTETSAIPNGTDLASHLDRITLENDDPDSLIPPNSKFDVWHRLVLHQGKLPFSSWIEPPRHIVRAAPESHDQNGKTTSPASFITVLVKHDETAIGLHRYRPGRVRVIFRLTGSLAAHEQRHLAYLDLFDPFPGTPDNTTGMYTTTPTYGPDGERKSEIFPTSELVSVCSLIPQRPQGNAEPRRIDTSADKMPFFLDHYSSTYTYVLVERWKQTKTRAEREAAQPNRGGGRGRGRINRAGRGSPRESQTRQ